MSPPTVNLLAAITSFIKVVETGSIAGAAKNLGLSAAAVSQTISRLEEHLGTRLLQRTTRSMALTEQGATYYERVRHIASDLESAHRAISTGETELQGRLCIASTSAFGRHVLAPLVAGFANRYPRLTLELCTTDGKINHIQDGIDLSLRIKPQLEEGIVARKIASVPFIICASPAYLARAGAPRTPEELQQHACLAFRYPLDGRFLRWGFIREGQHYYAALNVTAISDDIDALTQMAIHGAGIARLAEFLAAPFIESGRLVTLLESSHESTESCAEPLDIYACVQDRAAMTPKVKAFLDYLTAHIEQRWTKDSFITV